MPTSSGDTDVDAVLRQADQIAAERVIQAMRLDEEGVSGPRLRALVTAYGGLARSACREWLIDGSLSRAEVHALLTGTLLTVVRDVAPALEQKAASGLPGQPSR